MVAKEQDCYEQDLPKDPIINLVAVVSIYFKQRVQKKNQIATTKIVQKIEKKVQKDLEEILETMN